VDVGFDVEGGIDGAAGGLHRHRDALEDVGAGDV